MFEGRAAQVDLISLLSTGEARGGKLDTASVLDLCEECSSNCMCIYVSIFMYFELCCLIVGETFFQPTQLSGLC